MLCLNALSVTRAFDGSAFKRRARFVLRNNAASAAEAPLSFEQISDKLFLEAAIKPKPLIGPISITEISGMGVDGDNATLNSICLKV
jgi:hypothetical protein